MNETLKWMLYYDRQEIMDMATQQRLTIERPDLFPPQTNVDTVTGICIIDDLFKRYGENKETL